MRRIARCRPESGGTGQRQVGQTPLEHAEKSEHYEGRKRTYMDDAPNAKLGRASGNAVVGESGFDDGYDYDDNDAHMARGSS